MLFSLLPTVCGPGLAHGRLERAQGTRSASREDPGALQKVSAPGEVVPFSVLRERQAPMLCLLGREWLKLLRRVIGKPVVTLGGPRGRDKPVTGLTDVSKGGTSC